MFTKSLSRIALVSGLILGAGSIVPQVALADDVFVNNLIMDTLTWTPSKETSGKAIALANNSALTSTSVGTVNVKSNSVGGFTVTVTSANGVIGNEAGGLLKRSTGETMLYTIKYGVADSEVAVPLSVGLGTAETPSALDTTCASSSGCDRDVEIAIEKTQIDSKPAGDYSDTLTFTLANK